MTGPVRRIRLPGLRICGVALLIASCTGGDGSEAAQQIVDALARQQYGRASTRYRAQEAEVLAEAAAPTWRRALQHEDTTVREWAVDALSRIGMPQDGPLLAERLDDASRGVRQQAVEGLARIDPDLARREFAARLGSTAPEQVALGAQGLALLRAVDASPQILARLLDPELPAPTRGALTQPLATLGDPAVAMPLAELAVAEGDLQLRRLAAEAVIALEGPGVREAVQLLATSDDEYIRALAQEVLEAGRQ